MPEENETDVEQFRIFFPKGWGMKLCLRWLELRRLGAVQDADCYRFDSLFVSCPTALYGYWLSGWQLRWTFKKILKTFCEGEEKKGVRTPNQAGHCQASSRRLDLARTAPSARLDIDDTPSQN